MVYPMSMYVKCYQNAFNIDSPEGIEHLEFEGVAEWDSIGHMSLVSELEDHFKISIKLDDVIAWSSFQIGLGILADKYQISIV